jgi:hypothetical protein
MKKIGRLGALAGTVGVFSAIAPADAQNQTTPYLSYSHFFCICTASACDQFSSSPNASKVATPFVKAAGPQDSYPSWAPDSTRLAYLSDANIVVMNADDSNAVNITGTPEFMRCNCENSRFSGRIRRVRRFEKPLQGA